MLAAQGVFSDEGPQLAVLQRELTKQRNHKPIRKLFREISGIVPRLKPCMLMSPLSVAQYLDPALPMFDLVIFDEASQIPVWDAIGALGRATQAIVVGDPKQMPPTNFFERVSDEDDVGECGVEELESILDEALNVLPHLQLDWHYRSKFESLIVFSNRSYYQNRLITFPPSIHPDNAVKNHRVIGIYDRGGSRTNKTEAQAVVDFLVSHLEKQLKLSKKDRLSIGIITFNSQQQNLIENLVDNIRIQREEFECFFNKNGDDISDPVFVKNLENVQGDERDVILFSLTFGPDEQQKFTMNFGPINGANGSRRLNVAVSRARHEMHVFSSFGADQMNLSETSSSGVHDLKRFLDFASRGFDALLSFNLAPKGETESPLEEAIALAIRNVFWSHAEKEGNWDVHCQVGCSGYRIDLAVVDPRKPGRYLLGIECDGATYHSGATARDRDKLRQLQLERKGWRIHRVWSPDWWRDSSREVQKIKSLLEELMAEPLEDL